jgi:hypothetical protein
VGWLEDSRRGWTDGTAGNGSTIMESGLVERTVCLGALKSSPSGAGTSSGSGRGSARHASMGWHGLKGGGWATSAVLSVRRAGRASRHHHTVAATRARGSRLAQRRATEL